MNSYVARTNAQKLKCERFVNATKGKQITKTETAAAVAATTTTTKVANRIVFRIGAEANGWKNMFLYEIYYIAFENNDNELV